jgi:D-alanyl-D-alanine carboxypeptidase (penicillin-binding protein 5/6)
MNKNLSIINNTEIKFFGSLALILAFLLAFSFALQSYAEKKDDPEPAKVVLAPFPTVKINAKAAYVYDARTKTVLYGKNEDARLPLASLTKLMSALVAYESAPAYGTVTIGQDALKAEGDSGLLAGEKWSLKDLLDFSLITSSNDGIRAVALALGAISKTHASSDEIMTDFVSRMNEKASELKLKDTYFFNETGLDESEVKNGAYGSAKDLAMLFDYILTYQPAILERTKERDPNILSLDKKIHPAGNTNLIVDEIPGLLGSKTGFTDIAGGNLVIGFDPEIGRPIVISVLGSTEKGRFEDMRALVAATMTYINQ